MVERNFSLFFFAKVIAAGFERIPHHAISLGAPIERSGRGNASVHPVVGVDDGDFLSFVAEASVLNAAAKEVFVVFCFEGECGALTVKAHLGETPERLRAVLFVVHIEETAFLLEDDFHFRRFDDHVAVVLPHFHSERGSARRADENFGWRCGFGVTDDASVVVTEEAEDVVSVEIDVEDVPVGVVHLDGRRIDEFCPGDGSCLGCAACGDRLGRLSVGGKRSHQKTGCGSHQRERASQL